MKKKSSKQQQSKKGEQKIESKNSLPRQLLILLCSFILISVLYNEVNGYKWAVDSLLMENLEYADKYQEADLAERLQLKLGYNYSYLDFLIKNTPEDAIILIPPQEVIFKEGKNSLFALRNPYILARKAATSYYTYPRKLVFEDEKDSSALYSEITHVAIINGWGYDKLHYEVGQKQPNTVLPVDKQDAQ